jgi:hypothetical protein
MSAMVCDNCGRYGIHWSDLHTINPWTSCPHCGCKNCQRVPVSDDEDEQPADKGVEG